MLSDEDITTLNRCDSPRANVKDIVFFLGNQKKLRSHLSLFDSRDIMVGSTELEQKYIEETFEIRVDPIFSPMWNKVIMLK